MLRRWRAGRPAQSHRTAPAPARCRPTMTPRRIMSACDPCVWTCCQTRTRPAGCRPGPRRRGAGARRRDTAGAPHRGLPASSRRVFRLSMRAAPRGDGFAAELGLEPSLVRPVPIAPLISGHRLSLARPREPTGTRTVFSFTAISIERRPRQPYGGRRGRRFRSSVRDRLRVRRLIPSPAGQPGRSAH